MQRSFKCKPNFIETIKTIETIIIFIINYLLPVQGWQSCNTIYDSRSQHVELFSITNCFCFGCPVQRDSITRTNIVNLIKIHEHYKLIRKQLIAIQIFISHDSHKIERYIIILTMLKNLYQITCAF